jgi:hypothetical protein
MALGRPRTARTVAVGVGEGLPLAQPVRARHDAERRGRLADVCAAPVLNSCKVDPTRGPVQAQAS